MEQKNSLDRSARRIRSVLSLSLRTVCPLTPEHRALALMPHRRSFIAELFDFILSNKAYFIAPIIIVLLLVGALIILGGTKAAPFIYTLF